MGELERVITAMRKVIEKLQGDNEKLKRKKVVYESKADGKTTAMAGSSLLEENTKLKVNFFPLIQYLSIPFPWSQVLLILTSLCCISSFLVPHLPLHLFSQPLNSFKP